MFIGGGLNMVKARFVMEAGLAMAYNDGGGRQFWACLLVVVVVVSCIDHGEALVFGPWEFEWWKVITVSEGGT